MPVGNCEKNFAKFLGLTPGFSGNFSSRAREKGVPAKLVARDFRKFSENGKNSGGKGGKLKILSGPALVELFLLS